MIKKISFSYKVYDSVKDLNESDQKFERELTGMCSYTVVSTTTPLKSSNLFIFCAFNELKPLYKLIVCDDVSVLAR